MSDSRQVHWGRRSGLRLTVPCSQAWYWTVWVFRTSAHQRRLSSNPEHASRRTFFSEKDPAECPGEALRLTRFPISDLHLMVGTGRADGQLLERCG